MSDALAGVEALPGSVRARLRVFDDGVALFDPVDWRTHVLSPQGVALLGELLEVASAHPSEHLPEGLLHRFALSAGEAQAAGEHDAPGDGGHGWQRDGGLLELARIALHLRQDGV